MPAEECRRRWDPWTPAEVHDRLEAVTAPWGVVGGWAIDLHLGVVTREHDDIEIGVPAASVPEVADALAGFEWDIVGDGRIWPYPAYLDRFHQTWLRDPSTGRYHLDVFREPGDGEVWYFRRDPSSITLAYADVYTRTAAGIPHLVPELVLLFKACDVQPKDQDDFDPCFRHLVTIGGRDSVDGWRT